MALEQRGITNFVKHSPTGMPGEREFLFLSTFCEQQPQPVNKFEMGFTSETKAPDFFYSLEVLQLPRSASEFDLLIQDPIKESFNEN
jgi:hypothetical protein